MCTRPLRLKFWRTSKTYPRPGAGPLEQIAVRRANYYRRIAGSNVYAIISWITMFLVEFAASRAVQQSRTLIINGQSGQVSVLRMYGRSFVDLEALAQLANGSLGFHGDQIVLILPAPAGNVPAKAPSSCQPALSSGATIVVNLLGSRSDIEKSIWRLLVFHKIRTLARQTSVPQILP
jgi:hypothetical protein